MDPLTNHIFGGRYRAGALLGRGGVADVFRARDLIADRDVAVKAFRRGLELRDAERRRLREVDLVASLNHPGLVRVLDADVSDSATRRGGAPFIVFELVEGPTLRQRIQRGPMDEQVVASLGARLADTLDHVHRHGIVHRDVKPANVLVPDQALCEHGAKLADFGTALIVDSTRMTAEGFTVGTPSYLSPEQVTSARVGRASDVYSLGLVLIEALTGVAAFDGHGIEAALRRLVQQPVVPHHVDSSLAMTLTAMTARDPGARITAREAARQLTVIAEPSLASYILALGTPGRERHRPRHLNPARRSPARPFHLARPFQLARRSAPRGSF